MPDLSFQIEGAEAVRFAVAPLLVLKLRIEQAAGGAVPVHTVALRCQIRIEPGRRRYDAGEQDRLLDLFGEPARWGQTCRGLLWTHASVMVPSFTAHTVVDLPLPCTYDFNIAATKYFYALEEGDIPLGLLFSGTIFYEGPDGALQIGQIPWDRETGFRLPVAVWKDMMECYYPNSAWLCLRRDMFERLYLYKRSRGLPTWERALETLLTNGERRGVSPPC